MGMKEDAIESMKAAVLADVRAAQSDRAHIARRVDRRLLRILEDRFAVNLPCYQKREDGSYDPLDAMRRDAYREVILWLRWCIEQHKQETKDNDDE